MKPDQSFSWSGFKIHPILSTSKTIDHMPNIRKIKQPLDIRLATLKNGLLFVPGIS
jgi:hypothetical protein